MIYVFLANGFEEIEALATVDILKRAKIQVQTVGIESAEVTGANGIKVICDINISEINNNFNGIVLPGGMPGTENLFKSEGVKEIIRQCIKSHKLVGAICAAPIILGRLGMLKDKEVCCYPGFEDELENAKVLDESICVDDNIITGRGPGVSLDFAFKLVEIIRDEETALKIRKSMQCM